MNMIVFQAQQGLLGLTFGYLKTMSLKCALDLGIPDAINNNGKAMTLSQLHSALSLPSSNKSQLGRLMRLLSHFGFFSEESAEGCTEVLYGLTAISLLVIQKDEPTTMLPFVRCNLDIKVIKPSLYMGDWFMQDEKKIPFELVHGFNYWEILSKEPKVNKMFNDAMVNNCCLFDDILVKNGDAIFKGIGSLVDVGGGKGAMAELIAKNFHHVRCTVLDLPHVIADSPSDGIVKFVSGDMFTYIPPADAVLLKWVLHNWSNEDCIKLLRQCKDAIPSKDAGGKVIVLEAVVGMTSAMTSEETQLLFDMLMLTTLEGQERNEMEWKYLFTEAGFSSYKITHSIGFMSIIEIFP